MATDIMNISDEIVKFNEVLSEYGPKLESIKSFITSEIVNEQSMLDDILKKNSAEHTKFADLNTKAYKLKTDLQNYNAQISSLKQKKATMELEEGNLDGIRKEVEQTKEELSTLMTELELVKVEKEESVVRLMRINEDIEGLNKEKTSLIDSNALLNNSKISMSNNCQAIEKRLKSLSTEQDSEEKTLSDKKLDTIDEEKLLEQRHTEVQFLHEAISRLSSKKSSAETEVSKIQTEIVKLNEEKEVVVTEIEGERKKLHNEENRLIAIKKDVLKFILEYKDAGNKSQIAKFAQSVENAA